MSLINVSNLTFGYDGGYEDIFRGVSFQIDTDWRLGFTGRNGRGKTTFLKLLMGEYEYKGSISASVEFEYFPYETGDSSEMTINVVENIVSDYQYWELSRELNMLEVDEEILYRPFSTLSGGEQTKVLLAAMFLKGNSFLLIDEPTNHLDIRGRELVSRYLNSKKGFILVSHDRSFLDGCVDHVLSINKSDIEIQKGNFSSWLANKELRDSFELAENAKLKKEVKRLEAAAKEKSRWSDKAESRKIGIDPIKVDNKKGWKPLQAAKSKKLMARAKAIETRTKSAIEEKSKLLKNIETSDKLKISQQQHFSQTLITISDLSVSYGDADVFDNISFDVRKGDRIALCGKNGSGKSTVLKLICGEEIPHGGVVKKSSGLVISYISQDTAGAEGQLSKYAEKYGIDINLFYAVLSKLDFTGLEYDCKIESLSNGQRKKVLIARSLCEKAHLHIWDEPMNYIDVISRMQIEELLLDYKPTILFVEHDSAFVRKVATKTVMLDKSSCDYL